MQQHDFSRVCWRTSSYSGGGACVEVAPVARTIAVRDSKDPDGPRLIFSPQDWQRFLGQIGRAAYDL